MTENATEEPDFPVGSLIARKYEVLGSLGSTNSGRSVLWCRDTYETGEVAVKALTLRSTSIWAEAQHLRQLQDEHILRIRNAFSDAGTAFLVTDIAKHGTVQNEIDRCFQGVPVAESVRWVQHACHGVQRAHSHGLVHNDIKPANLFLSHRRDCFLGDFEMAGLIDSRGVATAHGFTHSTVAPEVLPAYEATTRSDVYSLGATAYWAITGVSPHPEVQSDIDLDLWFQNAAPTPIRLLAPHVPRGVARAVEKAMSINPTERFNSPAEFATALARVPAPKRAWDRVEAHPTHESCWRGGATKSSPSVLVCLRPRQDARGKEITVTYEQSNKRITKHCGPVVDKKALSAIHRIINNF
jgi:serine/threonine protein kinase